MPPYKNKDETRNVGAEGGLSRHCKPALSPMVLSTRIPGFVLRNLISAYAESHALGFSDCVRQPINLPRLAVQKWYPLFQSGPPENKRRKNAAFLGSPSQVT